MKVSEIIRNVAELINSTVKIEGFLVWKNKKLYLYDDALDFDFDSKEKIRIKNSIIICQIAMRIPRNGGTSISFCNPAELLAKIMMIENEIILDVGSINVSSKKVQPYNRVEKELK